jgi:hypothetical protein
VSVLQRPAQTADIAALHPIRIATDAIELVGSVAPTGQRVTDMLLRGQDVAFLPSGADPAPETWIAVAPSDILWVVPPPLPPRVATVQTTRRARLHVRIGSYRLLGVAHLADDGPVDCRLAAAHPFLPLTAASIGREGTPNVEDVSVVIVNMARSSDVRHID